MVCDARRGAARQKKLIKQKVFSRGYPSKKLIKQRVCDAWRGAAREKKLIKQRFFQGVPLKKAYKTKGLRRPEKGRGGKKSLYQILKNQYLSEKNSTKISKPLKKYLSFKSQISWKWPFSKLDFWWFWRPLSRTATYASIEQITNLRLNTPAHRGPPLRNYVHPNPHTPPRFGFQNRKTQNFIRHKRLPPPCKAHQSYH